MHRTVLHTPASLRLEAHGTYRNMQTRKQPCHAVQLQNIYMNVEFNPFSIAQYLYIMKNVQEVGVQIACGSVQWYILQMLIVTAIVQQQAGCETCSV